jgi:hypothetical protein
MGGLTEKGKGGKWTECEGKGRKGKERVRESVTIIRIDDEKGRGAWSKEAETWDGVFSSKLRA